MPVYRDEARDSWYCKFYYTDYTGKKRQKKKSGFKLQREAKEWERNFLERVQGTPDMKFSALYSIYMDDIEARCKPSGIVSRKNLFKNIILPVFGDRPVNAITAADIRKWQNDILKLGYSDAYLERIHGNLTSFFNFAMRYYNLPSNPCKIAGCIGKRTIRTEFWTSEEYNKFIQCITNVTSHVAFEVLYYSGCRFGELLALTLSDIDTDTNTIHITKTLTRINKKDIITTPKTPKSVRDIIMPAFVIDEITDYSTKLYGLLPDDRLFTFTRSFINNEMKRGCSSSGVKMIRIHDIRHSHASLLIELGFNPLLISERLGHEKVDTTLRIYSHLYPSRHGEVAARLQELHEK